MRKEKADLIISRGTVLTVNDCDEIIPDGAVAVRDGKILALGDAAAINASFSAAKRISAKDGLIMPGLVNTHTHAAMSILRGVADDMPLEEWLQDNIFPLEDRFVNKNFAYWGSLLAGAEMILSGTTTFCDMYFFEKETGRAAEKLGLRAVIGEGIATLGADEKEIWEKKMALTQELLKIFRKSPLVSIAVEPHSPYACGGGTIKAAKRFAREHDLLFVIHLAETEKEFEDSVRERKMTPVAYLDSLGVLDARTLCAHCVRMGKGDFKILQERGVKISHCPESNMKLGSGIAPVNRFLQSGIAVSLGTDGAASNNALDMLREMKSAALLAKVAALDPTALSARETVRLATIGGARVLGQENEIGSLELGKKADIIVLDLDQPHLTPVYDFYSHLAYCASGADVRSAVIDGKLVLENRRLKTADLAEILRRARAIAAKIKAAKR